MSNPSTPTDIWEAETVESLEAHGPADLVYSVVNRDPVLNRVNGEDQHPNCPLSTTPEFTPMNICMCTHKQQNKKQPPSVSHTILSLHCVSCFPLTHIDVPRTFLVPHPYGCPPGPSWSLTPVDVPLNLPGPSPL